MSDIIYMTGQQLIDGTSALSTQYAGVSISQAVGELGAEYYISNAQNGIVSFPFTQYFGGKPVSLEAQYASQLWNYWKITSGAAVTSLGAAASAAGAWASGVLFGDPALAGTLAGTGGLLTASIPATAAAVIPLLGVGFGGAMYDLSPEFWTKVSQAILPFAYKDTETIPLVVDSDGQVYVDKELVDALKQLFDDEGIGQISGKTSDLDTSPISQPIAFSSGAVAIRYRWQNGGWVEQAREIVTGTVVAWHLQTREYTTVQAGTFVSQFVSILVCGESGSTVSISGVSYTLGDNFTHDGRSVGWVSSGIGSPGNSTTRTVILGISEAYTNLSSLGSKTNEIAWTAIYGTSAGGYPDGSFAWQGNSVDYTQLPTIPVVSSTGGSTTPYIPITLHGGNQTVTADPSLYPDPTAVLSDISLLDPYISPAVLPGQWPTELPAPIPGSLVAPQVSTDPVYVPAPVLNPNNNPTLIPDIEPTSEIPTNLPSPSSSGQSPDPVFPVPDIPFPSWTPQGSDTPVVSGQPGFIQIYHPDVAHFVQFGRWLWVTYADSTIDKIWNNPFDGVIGAHELYATPIDGGYSTIRCGFLDSGIETQVVNQRYFQINCGSMVIPEYWGNYLDYSPYTQALIYLPFIGIVDLEADDIIGKAVNVLYHIDAYTGSCIAQITAAMDGYSNTLYQFSGNCSVEIPMSGASQAQIKAALMTANAYQNAANVSATAALVGGIGSGLASLTSGVLGGIASPTATGAVVGLGMGIASGLGSAISGAASSASQQAYGAAQHTANMLSGKALVQHSGSFGSSHGAMGIKKPYIIIRRPIQKVVNGYQNEYGFPAHKQVIIGSCKGFLRCREVHVLSTLATDSEKNLIEQLLTTGVYVTESLEPIEEPSESVD